MQVNQLTVWMRHIRSFCYWSKPAKKLKTLHPKTFLHASFKQFSKFDMKPLPRGLFLLIVLIQGQILVTQSEEESSTTTCVSKENCAECIRSAECSWCSQRDFQGGDKQPLSRCNTTAGHNNLGRFRCGAQFLYTPKNELNITRNDDVSKDKSGRGISIKPQKISLKLRRGVPVEIDVTLLPEDNPLDLYYLMDLTFSMKDDKVSLSNLGNQLGDKLQNLTKKYQQGFGSFIDKLVMPFARMSPAWLDNPCLGYGSCIRPYGFQHHLSLSSNLSEFGVEVDRAQLSASLDNPEGGLDALMQSMVCGRRIGWTDGPRKLVIFATDAPFHIAGDGKLGGIIRRNDGKCHLDENGMYTHSTEMDYPSIAQLNHEAIKNSVNIIFAVTSDQSEIYQQLANRIEGAQTAVLSTDSSNIVDLVVKEYQKITSTVSMSHSFPKQYLNITYYTECIVGPEKQTDVCKDLPVDQPVKFKVKIELLQCPSKKKDWKDSSKIYRVGRLQDGLVVDWELICDCPCEDKQNWIINSTKCERVGTEKCGLCECDPPYFGKFCECNAKGGHVPVDELKACTPENSEDVCSGRGNCLCGQCQCNKRENPDEKYSGKYCECDNFSCLKSNRGVCDNHGSCECGKCSCSTGWTGVTCDCSTDEGTCVKTGSDDMCSGNGKCICGKCVCEGKYTGSHCEKCLHESCPTRCEELTPCVQCKIFGSGEIDNAADCENTCRTKPIKTVEVISQDSSTEDEVLCKAEDATDDCAFYFVYDQTLNEPSYIDVQKTKECPPKLPIFWILVAIISIVVIVGICLIIAWKVCTVVADRREFARFESERSRSAFKNTENPLYHTPIATYQNPSYGKRMKE